MDKEKTREGDSMGSNISIAAKKVLSFARNVIVSVDL
jgi:hypothetical protein